jgi:hypothetical protein
MLRMTQLSLIAPSKGTRFYKIPYLGNLKEQCKGGLVFDVGTKLSCRECVRTCNGCIEMIVKFNPDRYDELAHLLQEETQCPA